MKTFRTPRDIKVAMIGYSAAFNSRGRHFDNVQKAGMRPFAVCDLDPERLEAARADFPGIETYDDLDVMLEASEVDLVVHNTPHHLHFPLAAKCVKAGKHVVLEKPMVVTTADADRLIALADRHDVMISTLHNRHWDGWIMRAYDQIVNKGAIGDVFRVELHMGDHAMPRDWWRSSRSISGGIMYDWGVHLLEYALQIVDSDVAEVSGYAKNGHWQSKVPKRFSCANDMNEDEATAIVRFANGAMVNLSISHLDTSGRPPVAFHGTRGSYTVDYFGGPDRPAGWTTRTATKTGKIVVKTGKHPKGKHDSYYKNIADHLTGRAKLVITPQWARRPVHIIDLAMRSAAQGRALKAKHG